MATDSWTTTMLHTSDSEFRDWGLELSTRLGTIGLTQTSDTGQIDWGTVTRPGTNTDAGYEIWRFNDTLQATAPIFIKLFYGTGGTANGPRLQFQIGTGSNGAGTLTGTTTSTINCTANNSAAPTGTPPYFSTLCYTEGHLGLVFKHNAGISTGRAKMSLLITRTVDENGDFNATGCFVSWPNTGNTISSSQNTLSIRFATPAQVYTTNTNFVVVPGDESTSTVDGDTQAYIFWMITPQVRPVISQCAVYSNEITINSTFQTNLVGVSQRTYISTGRQIGQAYANVGGNIISTAMLWE